MNSPQSYKVNLELQNKSFIFAKNKFMKKKSGRKKVADKKEQVPLFIRRSIIIAQGGKDAMRDKIYQFIGQSE